MSEQEAPSLPKEEEESVVDGALNVTKDSISDLMTTVHRITPSEASLIEPSVNAARDIQVPTTFPSALVGSIMGTRSESGTMVELKGLGSFEDVNSPKTTKMEHHSRSRAATAPPILASSLVVEEPPVHGTMTPDGAVNGVTLDSAKADEEDDDEIKMAMAMALAIQNNPNLTPAEIHELFTSTAQTKPPASKPPKSTMMSSFSMAATTSISNATAAKPVQNRFSQMFSSFAATTTTLSPATSAQVTPKGTADTISPSPPIEVDPGPTATPSAATSQSSVASNVVVVVEPPLDVVAASKTNVVAEESRNTPSSAATLASVKTAATPNLSPSFSKQISQRTGMLFKSASQRKNEATTPTAVVSPVRLSGVAWKRRGGMGKYSASAWERRRIELVGTKLLYYLMDQETDALLLLPPDGEDPAAVEATTEGSTRGTRSWSADSGTNHKEPRGFLDIAKEKATVNAAFGHSGAPTPFALSIKVRGETKWKLCFERHAVEMEWLAAISDIVIQSSVDAYNNSLLEAADPSNHADFTLFHPPLNAKDVASTKGATAVMGTSTQHRLWMLDDYRVGSSGGMDEGLPSDALPGEELPLPRDMRSPDHMASKPPLMEEAEDTADAVVLDDAPIDVVSATEYASTSLDPELIQDTILSESNQVWVVPQSNLPHILTVVNLSLFYARSSSTTMEGFWSLVVSANLGIFLCLAKQPTWQSILELVKAIKVPTGVTATTIPKARRTKAMGSATTMPSVTTKDTVSSSVRALDTVQSDFIPEAGSTSVHLKETTDIPQNAKGEMFAGWCSVPGEILAVRSHGYAVTKKKVPSPGELYECIHVEVFESPQRYPDMATRVKLPKVEFDDDVRLKTWRCPDLFIISIALPTDTPRMGKTSSDGGGYTITMYYRMKAETRDILRRVTADGYDPSSEVIREEDLQKNKVNAVRLLEEWVRRAPTDHKFQSRFKIVPNAHNLKEIGMPSWIAKYNGKPFLIKRPGVTGFLYSHPELSCVEFDVSLHPFPYLAKQAICYMKDSYFKKVLVSFGFVIEGRSDDEVRLFERNISTFTRPLRFVSHLLYPLCSLAARMSHWVVSTLLPRPTICYPSLRFLQWYSSSLVLSACKREINVSYDINIHKI